MKILTTAPAGSPEWHAARKGKIGGTAAADIICGADRNLRTFGSPLSQWARLTGRVEKDANPDGDPELAAILKWGNESEPLHRKLLADETGGTFEGPPGVLQHDTIDWLAVSPDGRCVLPQHGRGSIELKAPTRYTVHEWEGGAPLPYQVQAAAVMAVEGTPFCLASALIPPAPRWAIVVRDAAFEQFMLDTLGRFMDFNVAKDIPPDATFRPVDKALLVRLHPKDNGEVVELAREFEEEFFAYHREKAESDALESAIEGRRNRIAQAIGPNTEGRIGPFRATHKHQTRTTSCKHCGATSTSEFRVLRIPSPKP